MPSLCPAQPSSSLWRENAQIFPVSSIKTLTSGGRSTAVGNSQDLGFERLQCDLCANIRRPQPNFLPLREHPAAARDVAAEPTGLKSAAVIPDRNDRSACKLRVDNTLARRGALRLILQKRLPDAG